MVSLLLISSFGFAENSDATDALRKAQDLYAQREVTDNNGKYSNIETAIAHLSQAAIIAETEETQYDIAILTSRCNYWLGQHSSNKEYKLEKFQAAMVAANSAKAINDEYAEGFYFYGVALSRWAETNGVMSSLGKKDELMKAMKDTKIRITREDEKGETVDGRGADRILGRVYYKLPGFAGGSRSESLKYLSVAFNDEPKYFINGIFYAETLADGGSKDELAKGCEILKDILSKNPEDGYPERLPENKEDIADAKVVFNKYCK